MVLLLSVFIVVCLVFPVSVCLLVLCFLLCLLFFVFFLCCAFAFHIAVCFPVDACWFVSVMPVVLLFVVCVD